MEEARKEELLEIINTTIREEKGVRVTMDSMLADAELDSFGIVVLLLELDSQGELFRGIPEKEDPFESVGYSDIPIKELISKCI